MDFEAEKGLALEKKQLNSKRLGALMIFVWVKNSILSGHAITVVVANVSRFFAYKDTNINSINFISSLKLEVKNDSGEAISSRTIRSKYGI